MKHHLLLASVFIFAISACSNSNNKSAENNSSTENTHQQVATTEEAMPLGESLIKKNDCFTCHTIPDKKIGPAYVDIATKYEPTEANIDSLTDKIIKGGKGVWGEVPMAAHPTLSKDDAREMAKYILSLKPN